MYVGGDCSAQDEQLTIACYSNLGIDANNRSKY